MDPYAGCFDGPRARDAFVLRVVMEPPWAVEVADEAPLTAVVLLAGSAVVVGPSGTTSLSVGDVLLARGPAPYALASSPDARPSAVVGADQACAGPGGRDLAVDWRSGVRTWGNDPRGRDVAVVGTFRSRGEVGRLLLDALPATVVVADPDPAVVGVLAREVGRAGADQPGVLDRLLDLLLIASVRQWSTTSPGVAAMPAGAPDPVVRDVVRLMHDDPAAAWTVDGLARRVGVSRASLTRRFTQRTGTPPMTYLTTWRLALAADLLRDDALTLTAVARRVGYGSPFSFSAAFKRQFGRSPQEYRSR